MNLDDVGVSQAGMQGGRIGFAQRDRKLPTPLPDSSIGRERLVPEHIPFLRGDGELIGTLPDAVREMEWYFITKRLKSLNIEIPPRPEARIERAHDDRKPQTSLLGASDGNVCPVPVHVPFLRSNGELKGSLAEAVREMKRYFITKHLIENDYNLSATNRALGLKGALRPLLRSLDIETPPNVGGRTGHAQRDRILQKSLPGASKGSGRRVPEYIRFLQGDGQLSGSLPDAVREMKRYFITKSLIENDYNLSATSRALGLNKPPTATGKKKSNSGIQTLRQMIVSLGIEIPPRPPQGTAGKNAPARRPEARPVAKR